MDRRALGLIRPVLLAAFLVTVPLAAPASAAAGDLDLNFSGDGKLTTNFGTTSTRDFGDDVAIQSNDKIVVAGTTTTRFGLDFALARYNPGGGLDTSFSGDGKATVNFRFAGIPLTASTDLSRGVAIQSDGKIVVAGFTTLSSNTDFAVARFISAGALDTTFGGGGAVITDFGTSNDQASAVAIQPSDSKLVAAGCASCVSQSSDFALARYNTNGTLDASFSGDGKLTTNFLGSDDAARGVAIQPADGKIVAAGSAAVSGQFNFALARYNPSGILDTTFSWDGIQTTDFLGENDQAFDLAIQANGKIVAAGLALVSGQFDFALARYNAGGALDTTFSGDGRQTTDFGTNDDRAFGLAIQPSDGKLVAAGCASCGSMSSSDFAVARYLAA